MGRLYTYMKTTQINQELPGKSAPLSPSPGSLKPPQVKPDEVYNLAAQSDSEVVSKLNIWKMGVLTVR